MPRLDAQILEIDPLREDPQHDLRRIALEVLPDGGELQQRALTRHAQIQSDREMRAQQICEALAVRNAVPLDRRLTDERQIGSSRPPHSVRIAESVFIALVRD